MCVTGHCDEAGILIDVLFVTFVRGRRLWPRLQSKRQETPDRVMFLLVSFDCHGNPWESNLRQVASFCVPRKPSWVDAGGNC